MCSSYKLQTTNTSMYLSSSGTNKTLNSIQRIIYEWCLLNLFIDAICSQNEFSFRCGDTVDPLALKDKQFFHPSKDRWQRVPDRPTAWRLQPNSYIWVPSTQLFPETKNRPFPREFVLFITMRLINVSQYFSNPPSLRINPFVANVLNRTGVIMMFPEVGYWANLFLLHEMIEELKRKWLFTLLGPRRTNKQVPMGVKFRDTGRPVK